MLHTLTPEGSWFTSVAECGSLLGAQVLGFDLLKSGIFSVLPWMTMAVTSNLGGWIADTLVTRGVSVTRVRKIMQSVRASKAVFHCRVKGRCCLTTQRSVL